MKEWMNGLWVGPETSKTTGGTRERATVTRHEMSALFADDLARPALQKRAGMQTGKTRRKTAGCHPLFA